MIFRLVFENLKHRPVRTALSMVLIGAQVTMILALVGVSHGVLDSMAERARGTGADIVVKPPDSSVISFSKTMPDGVVGIVRALRNVALATGVYVETIGTTDTITGIHLDEFKRMAGSLGITKGQEFSQKDDMVVDETFAATKHLKVGDPFRFGHQWHVTGIMEGGKLSRTLVDIDNLREVAAEPGKISVVYVKVDDEKNVPAVLEEICQRLNGFPYSDQEKRKDGYMVQDMKEFVSLITVDNVAFLKPFINMVIGIAAIVGFLVTLLSMYMAVQERTREIGILKAMGASPAYIVGMLLRETFVLALAGILFGFLMSLGSKELLAQFAPSFPQEMVPRWYLYSAAIALGGSLVGAIYPGLKAARQDAIEALAYD